MSIKSILPWALSVLFICATCTGISLQNRVSYSPSDIPLAIATWLLEAVAAQNQLPSPDDIPENLRFSIWDVALEQCWDLLSEQLRLNNNQYTLQVAGIYGNYGTPMPSNVGSTQVILEVAFPNGASVLMQYYQSTLEVCR